MSTAPANNTANLDVAQGQNVLKQEAQAINNLAAQLGDSFQQAIELIYSLKGRIIISGMGKSGHIGAKMAATFASTGTPSFYLHPGEASHGDLGMISSNDAILAISHSGETKELSDLIAYCTRFSIPLIALVGNAHSTLGKAATVTLINGVTQEACPINMAPTTSTTASLALGDALAVTLMHKRGFQPEDFTRFHPGGKLGSRLLKVKDIMATGIDIPTIEPSTTMDKVILEMTQKNMGGVAITDETNTLMGIISDGDLKRHMSNDLLTKTAQEVMSTNPKVVKEGDFATSAVKFMQDNSITVLYVVSEQNKVTGVLHILHCLSAGVV